ncbi:MAG: ABC transporter permease, partial [Gammaproteobacteria bacterium]|nr:ABC transporter permease [Gammaproteobacteria bacterium]
DPKANAGRKVVDLLRSSPSSWLSNSPTLLPDFRQYPTLGFPVGPSPGPRTLAVMLQGRFESAFAGEPSPLDAQTPTSPAPKSAAGKAAPESLATPATAPSAVIGHSPPSARLILVGSSSMFDDRIGNLISQTLGTRYLKGQQFVQNVVDWSLEDPGLLGLRGRDRFASTLVPMSRATEQFWEYLNYALALGGLIVIWLISRRRRRRMLAQYLQLLDEA